MDSTGLFKVPFPVDSAEATPSTSQKEENAPAPCQNCKKLVAHIRKRSTAFQNVVKAQRTDYTKLFEHASTQEDSYKKEKSERGKLQQKYRQQLARSAWLAEELARVTGTLKKTAECATQTDADAAQSSQSIAAQSTDQSTADPSFFSFTPVPSPASSPGSLSVNASDSGFSEKSASPHLPKVPAAETKKRRRAVRKTVEKPSNESPVPNDGFPPPKPKRKRAAPKPKQQPQKESSLVSETTLDAMAMDIDQLLGFDDVPSSVPADQPEPAATVRPQHDVAPTASNVVPLPANLPPDISVSPSGLSVTKKRKRAPPKKAAPVQVSEPTFAGSPEAVPGSALIPPKKIRASRRKKQVVACLIGAGTGDQPEVAEVSEKPKKPRKPRVTKKKEPTVPVEPPSKEVQQRDQVLSKDVGFMEDERPSAETLELMEMISEFSFDHPILSPPSPLRAEDDLQETEDSMSSLDVDGLLRKIHEEFDVEPLVDLVKLDEIPQAEFPDFLSAYL